MFFLPRRRWAVRMWHLPPGQTGEMVAWAGICDPFVQIELRQIEAWVRYHQRMCAVNANNLSIVVTHTNHVLITQAFTVVTFSEIHFG